MKVTCHHYSCFAAPEAIVTVHIGQSIPFVDVQIGEVENTVFRPREELRAWLQHLRAQVDAAIARLAEPLGEDAVEEVARDAIDEAVASQ